MYVVTNNTITVNEIQRPHFPLCKKEIFKERVGNSWDIMDELKQYGVISQFSVGNSHFLSILNNEVTAFHFHNSTFTIDPTSE